MDDLKLVWKIDSNRYGSSQSGYLGKWKVVSIFYDGTTGRDDPNKEKLVCLLPGIKNVVGKFKTTKEAQIKATEVVEYWLHNLEILNK